MGTRLGERTPKAVALVSALREAVKHSGNGVNRENHR